MVNMNAHLLCIGGLPGVGKTTLAVRLSEYFQGSVNICPDVTRLQVMGKNVERDVVTNTDLRPDITALTIKAMKEQAEKVLKDGKLVIIGSAFIGERMRVEYTQMAENLGYGFTGVWLEVDEDTRFQRAAKRFSEYQERKNNGLDRGFNASAVIPAVVSGLEPEGKVTWDRMDASGNKGQVFSSVLEKLNHLNPLS